MHILASALQLLDDSGTPADIGAHVQTAISRLSEVIGETDHVSSHVSQTGGIRNRIGKAN
jgi:hypothetical protein